MPPDTGSELLSAPIPEDQPAQVGITAAADRSKLDPARKKRLFVVVPLILGNELCERLAYYGMATNLINYVTGVLHVDNATASSQLNIWSGTCYITPLLGAFIADSYLGRFWTIFSLNIVYMLGLVLLTLSAALPALEPANGQNPSSMQTGVFWLALYLIALGTGGIKPNVASFGADQFNDNCPAEVAGRSRFYNWFYLFVNIGSLIAALVLVPIQENIGWAVGFAVPAGAFLVALLLFASGYRVYTFKRPTGSSLGRVFSTGFVAFKKRRDPLPANHLELFEIPGPASAIRGSRKIAHSDRLKFLDHAAVITAPLLPRAHADAAGSAFKQHHDKAAAAADGSAKSKAGSPYDASMKADSREVKQQRDSSKTRPISADSLKLALPDKQLRTVTHCEEAKILLLLLPLLLPNIIYQTVYNQMGTLFVLQGDTMDRTTFGKLQVPSATVSFVDTASVMVTCVVYDSMIAPWFAARGKPLSSLRRIGWGYVVSIISMVVAAVLEMARLSMVQRLGMQEADYLGGDPVPMSVWWLVPQYALIGVSEVCANVGIMDLYYAVAPDSSKSYAQALTLITSGISGYLSSALVAGVQAGTSRDGAPGWIPNNLNVGHLDYFYWLLAALQVVGLIMHIPIAKRFDTRNPHENQADLGPASGASRSRWRRHSSGSSSTDAVSVDSSLRLNSLLLYQSAIAKAAAERQPRSVLPPQIAPLQPAAAELVPATTGYLSSFNSSLERKSGSARTPATETARAAAAAPMAPQAPVIARCSPASAGSASAAGEVSKSEGSGTSRQASLGAMDIMLRH